MHHVYAYIRTWVYSYTHPCIQIHTLTNVYEFVGQDALSIAGNIIFDGLSLKKLFAATRHELYPLKQLFLLTNFSI